ncbi:MAG: response regulator transcription factor [Bacteroidota bacterium]
MPKILIVEDEPSMRLGLKDNLEFESYEVETAVDGEDGLVKMIKTDYDLILLDVMMPKMSGFDVCKKARKEGVSTPIIFLTAKGEEIDKVLGLELGADDYIIKPFGLREMLARVKAVLRRTQGNIPSENKEEAVKTVGRLRIDFQHYEAFEGEEKVKLSHKEFEILSFLLKHKGEVVDRHELLEKVWGYENNPTTRTVDNFILKLRQKVEENSNDPKIILTVHGIGYKLID